MMGIDGIERLVEPVLVRLGLELHNVELFREGRGLVLRITADRSGGHAPGGGVTVDELADASAEIGAVLDLEDPIGEPYRLTLESPGIERELVTVRQFAHAVGERVRLVTRGEDAGVVEGDLSSFDPDSRDMSVLTADGPVTVNLSRVKSGRTVFDWDSLYGQKIKF